MDNVLNDEESTRPRPRYVIQRDKGKMTRTDVDPSGNLTLKQDFQLLMHNWPNSLEKYIMASCAPVLGLAGIATGFYLNRHFRHQLYLLGQARISSYIIMFIFPSLAAGGMHIMRVSDPLFQNLEKCAVCTQVRSGITQVVTGVLYPMILAPAVSFPLASREKSYSLPKLKAGEPFRIFHFAREMYKPVLPNLMYIAIAQVVLAMGVTFFEQAMYYNKILPAIQASQDKENTGFDTSS